MTAKILSFNGLTNTAPRLDNRKVLRRPPNSELRSREYLTPNEVEALMAAARKVGRHGHRDATLILPAYRHGLRVSELISLQWDMVHLEQGRLHVTRSKNGSASVHPLDLPLGPIPPKLRESEVIVSS